MEWFPVNYVFQLILPQVCDLPAYKFLFMLFEEAKKNRKTQIDDVFLDRRILIDDLIHYLHIKSE